MYVPKPLTQNHVVSRSPVRLQPSTYDLLESMDTQALLKTQDQHGICLKSHRRFPLGNPQSMLAITNYSPDPNVFTGLCSGDSNFPSLSSTASIFSSRGWVSSEENPSLVKSKGYGRALLNSSPFEENPDNLNLLSHFLHDLP